MTPFNKPHLTGKEVHYMYEAVNTGKISGNGLFTQKCHSFFEETFGFKKALLTSSCTDALEMAAILCDINPGDEVIIPSYTFVSTANAFVLRGAKIIFADSMSLNPNIDANQIELLITAKTKAIVPVHYAGIACDMEKIMQLAEKYNILVVEDAAQAIDSYFTFSDGTRKALGSIGHFAAFSFHETKNIIAGEGGMLAINDSRFIKRAEIIWEKGTNRTSFFRGEVDKYGWVDVGSSFLPSEITAAFLWAQLEEMNSIQSARKSIWYEYQEGLQQWAEKNHVGLPFIPNYATNNMHMFYLVCPNQDFRERLISFLKEKSILSVFHYQSLHASPYYADKHDNRELKECDHYAECLLRLPMWVGVEVKDVVEKVLEFH
jgi:dTDP-4-amino-4,6-dideoxygalactose transaminase